MRAAARSDLTMAVIPPMGDTVDRPARAVRRIFGMWVLMLALVSALGIRALMAPGEPGSPSAQPIPLPPAIGTCVTLDDTSADLSVVPCAEPHSGEVVMTWLAGRTPIAKTPNIPPMTFSLTRSLTAGSSDGICRGWVQDYTGWTGYLLHHHADLWIPPQPLVAGTLVAAPADQGLPDRHWTACVAQIAVPMYRGSVRDVARTYESHRPDAVSVCVATDEAKVIFPQCTQAHTVELLGTVALTQPMMLKDDIAVDHTRAEIDELCLELAQRLTGVIDPSYGGQLEVVTESVWQQSPAFHAPSRPGWVVPDCLIRVIGPGELVGSVVGLGDAELPLRS